MQHYSIVRHYDGHTITYREDGWFNATEAAAKYRKRPGDWTKLPEAKRYIAALQRSFRGEKIPLLKIQRGGKGHSDSTWMHPKLAVTFSRWLDDDFAVWCDMQIDDIIRNKQDWTKLRHMSVASAKFLHATIKETREEAGKELKDRHFMCEHKLVNYLLTGKFEGLKRDTLQGWQLDFIGHFDMRDGALMLKGLDYQQRKTLLTSEAVVWKTANRHRIDAANELSLIAA